MSDNEPKTPKSIPCDMCLDEDRKPALKTCMKCEISMCVQHLQAHLNTPVLLHSHPLVEPIDLEGNLKCPLHGKLLEYYCLDDLTCVCVSCAIEDQHRLHNMKTFPTAHKELMEKLHTEQQVLEKKIDEDNTSLDKWEKKEKEQLGRCSVRLIEAVTSLRDISLTSVQSSVSARMVSIKTSKSSLEAAQNEKDTFRFLQMYSQVHQNVEKAKAVDLRKGLEPGKDRDKLVQEIRQNGEKMLEQASKFLGSLLTLVDPENHQEASSKGGDLIFEPVSLGSCLSLSKDKRKVFHHDWLGECPATLLITTTEPAHQIQRWVINLTKETDWIIGLCDNKAKNDVKKGPIYGLFNENGELGFHETNFVAGPGPPSFIFGRFEQQQPVAENSFIVFTRSLANLKKTGEHLTPLEKVEVIWNFAESTLSFFKRTGPYQKEEITTIKISHNGWNLVPFVYLDKRKRQTSDQQYARNVFFGGLDNTKNFGGAFGFNQQVSLFSNVSEMLCELIANC